ncbi:MAG: DUF1080 domain-containing protein, partial [Planctomycetes bacterium]|nr:DUF1080 domain-containing protein [Planctomycetota bacterium]
MARSIGSIALCAGLLAGAAFAGDGFRSLFNGKDLTGWDGDPRLWSVRDGAIRGETTPENRAEGNTFLIWRGGTLRDFELRLSFRIQNGNSGVQYRSQDLGSWRVSGYQAEVCNGEPQVGFLYHERGRGSLARVGEFVEIGADGTKEVVGSVADPKALVEAGYYEPKQWNEYAIRAQGNHIIHRLNGVQTIELIDGDPKGRALEGILALQIHAGPPMVVEFKDLRLRTLAGPYGGARRLFNGKDLAGWTFSGEALKDAWSVKDGILACTGRPAGYLRTTEDWTNFVLRCQFRHLTGGNGGVLLRIVGPDKVWPRSIEAQGASGRVGDIYTIDQFPLKAAEERTRGRHTRKIHPSNERALGEWNEY